MSVRLQWTIGAVSAVLGIAVLVVEMTTHGAVSATVTTLTDSLMGVVSHG